MVQTPTRQLFDQFKHMQEMPLQRKCRQWVTPPTPTYSWWWKTSLWLDILLKHGFINAINVNNSQHMLVLNSPKLGSFIRYVCLLWAPLSSHTYVVVESIIKYCHSTTFTNEKNHWWESIYHSPYPHRSILVECLLWFYSQINKAMPLSDTRQLITIFKLGKIGSNQTQLKEKYI